MVKEGGRGCYIQARGRVAAKESRWSNGQGLQEEQGARNCHVIDPRQLSCHCWMNRPKTTLESMVQIVGRSMRRQRVFGGPRGLCGLQVGPGGPTWQPLGPRLGVSPSGVFQILPKLFTWWNSVISFDEQVLLGSFLINPPAVTYSPKLMEFTSLNPYTYVW